MKIQALDDVLIEGKPLARGETREVTDEVGIFAAISGRVFILPDLPKVQTASATPVK